MRRTLVAVALLAFAVGCGQTGGSTGVASVKGTGAASQASASPTPSVDPAEQGRKFAQCMRDHGVDMPDPETDGNGRMSLRLDAKGGKGEVDKAMEACKSLSPFGEKGREISPEQQEQVLAFVQCMRDNGVDMPDPDFSGGGGVTIGKPGGKNRPDGPTFRKASEACRDKLGPMGVKRP